MIALSGTSIGLLRFAAAALSAALLALAFPPVSDAQMAWGAFVPLLVMARFTTPKQCFRWGWLSGFMFWLASLFWLLKLGDTGGPWPLAVTAWLLISAYNAVYSGLFLFVVGKMFKQWGTESTLVKPFQLLAMPLLWVGLEFIRANIFTGFPWNQLGISQYRNLLVIQIAELGGVYAVSALVMIINAALALTTLRFIGIYRRIPGITQKISYELMIGLVACGLCLKFGSDVLRKAAGALPAEKQIRIAAIQPGVEQVKKWTKEFEENVYNQVRIQTDLALIGEPDLVVWPETAVPNPLKTHGATAEFVLGFATNGAPLLVGTMELAQRQGREILYNSSILVSTNGRIAGEYRKVHLVPFGEYIPLTSYLPFLENFAPLGFTCEPGDVSTVFRVGSNDVPFSTLICFEDVFPELARRSVRNGARLLINQTNDGWYDGSAGPLQHMSHCVFRCVENRVAAVRAANTGVTCHIDKFGRILDVLDQGLNGEFRIVAADVETWAEPVTFYGRYGDLPFAVPCCVIFLVSFAAAAYSERKQCATGVAAVAVGLDVK